MKLFTAFVMTIAMLVVGAFSQGNTSTRPRVSPTATPPTLGNDTSVNTTPSGPPVLIGGNNRPVPTPTPSASDDEIIRVETNLVTMPVSVLDRDRRFISGLQQNDFKIFENGVEQKLDYFQSVEQPFTVILLIDVSPSTQFKIDEIQNAASAFIDQLRPADRVMVISFDESVHVLTPATNNRYQLKNAIRQLEFGDGTSLYEAVNYVIDNQLRQIQGRKAVVLFTDGVDTTSSRANYASTLRESEEVDALFYTIRYDTSRDMNGGGWGNGGGGNPQPRQSKLIFTSVPLDFGQNNDSWIGFQTERALVLDALIGIPGILFLSADQHYFAAYRHAHGVREYQTGPLRRGVPELPPGGPGILFRHRGHNAGVLDVHPDRIEVTGLGADGEAFYREILTAEDLTPRV